MIIHPAEEGGFWAEVPAIQGCATQGETIEELLANIYEAVEVCFSVDLEDIELATNDRVLEIAVWNQSQGNSLREFWKITAGF